MAKYPVYELTLHKTYYDKGFFNLGVDVDRFVRSKNGRIAIYLGESRKTIIGRVDRNANINRTPRIHGGSELRNWFQRNFQLKNVVNVYLITPDDIWIKRR